MLTYRWLTDDEIERWVNPACVSLGWPAMNINPERPTCRVMGAFHSSNPSSPAGFFGLQMMPVLGPQWVSPKHRDGTVLRGMTDEMSAFLAEVGARGCMAVCDNPISERLAARHAMSKVEQPVYVFVGGE